MITILKALLISFIEGLTEFIPVSSTGHMIIANKFINLSSNEEFVNAFIVIIQLGAILSVVVYFKDKFLKFSLKSWLLILCATIPAAVLGLLLDDFIEQHLFNYITVALALIFYGIVLILIEKLKKKESIGSLDMISYKKAVYIGLFQCLAMIPGTSRSAATIIGAMLLGLKRVLATEFSFFLAIPTMIGASALKIIKMPALTNFEYMLIALGFVSSFIFAYIFIAVFLSYIKKHDFKIFGIYRIIVGVLVLILFSI